jgi:hypothetical protein
MILIKDDFLSKTECDKLLSFYKKHEHLMRKWPPKDTGPCAYLIGITHKTSPLIKNILSRIESYAQIYFNSNLKVDWAELKKQQKGSHHQFHYDTAKERTRLASITYLNTLSSGNTVFKEGLEIQPRAGRSIWFDGQLYFHGVSTTDEDRYTIPAWYFKP